MSDERAARGQAILTKLTGSPPPEGPLLPLAEFSKITVEHLFGDVWTRPGLEIEQRELITLATLIAAGRETELRFHFSSARNLGLTRQALEEVIIHVAHYAGWPTGVGASRVLAEVWPPDAA